MQYVFNISNIFGCCFIIFHFSFLLLFESSVSFIFQIDSLATRETIITNLCFLVFLFLLLLESYIYIWIAQLNWIYLVLVWVPDTVQPCDTTQVRSDSNFGLKSTTVQVYNNSHNSQSDRWIGLQFYVHSSVLERTESDLSKINWLLDVILLNPIVLVPWGTFPLCHTPIRPISAFRDQISILIVGCVTMRFASLGIRARLRNKVISFCYFRFFSVPLSFSVFASIFLFFMSASSKQKKKGVIFYLVTVSNHISILKRKRDRN